MSDVLKELEDYQKKYGNTGNGITFEDVYKVADEYQMRNVFGIAQLFCNIGYMRGYRAGQRDSKEGEK